MYNKDLLLYNVNIPKEIYRAFVLTFFDLLAFKRFVIDFSVVVVVVCEECCRCSRDSVTSLDSNASSKCEPVRSLDESATRSMIDRFPT